MLFFKLHIEVFYYYKCNCKYLFIKLNNCFTFIVGVTYIGTEPLKIQQLLIKSNCSSYKDKKARGDDLHIC